MNVMKKQSDYENQLKYRNFTIVCYIEQFEIKSLDIYKKHRKIKVQEFYQTHILKQNLFSFQIPTL